MADYKRFTIEERVRWGDVDAAGIIFYGSYIRFFEIAETELFRAMGMPYGKVFDELEIVEDAAHLTNIEQPEEFNKAMLAFLKSIH